MVVVEFWKCLIVVIELWISSQCTWKWFSSSEIFLDFQWNYSEFQFGLFFFGFSLENLTEEERKERMEICEEHGTGASNRHETATTSHETVTIEDTPNPPVRK